MPRFLNIISFLLVGGVLFALLIANYRTQSRDILHTVAEDVAPDAHIDLVSHPITVNTPGPPVIELQTADPQGRTASVACSTCHSIRKPNLDQTASGSLKEFHQGMQVSHGKLACYACHDPENADALRLAGGKTVEYRDVITLCSQCHSSQATSFAHGAHGGMNGFWDLSRGPQTKNNCIDCHDPHAPKFPKMVVGFKPYDRFLEGEASHDDHQ